MGFDVKMEGKIAKWRFGRHFSSCLGISAHRRNRKLACLAAASPKINKKEIIANTNDEIATVEDNLLAADWQHSGRMFAFFFFQYYFSLFAT